ncbi:AMP-binding protein [Nocardia sp. alder85J]|uniref:AMP-binding protein n=1 Tax=Nocardia sp. alder85J TaxID=2862949 RepID=UPI001CD6CA9F|nr:AMP-binding protein [Nocardia sp. alder85J]MCX4093339.1 AMP-binding protein [Nocardia sp. alder85J]
MTTSPTATGHRDGFVPGTSGFRGLVSYWSGRPPPELLRESARRQPDRPALLTEGGAHSYADLDAAAGRWAHGFLGLGIAPGDRVVVQLPNVPEFVPVLFGLLRAGIVPMLTLPARRRAEIEHLARLSGAVASLIPDRAGNVDHRMPADEIADVSPELRHVLVPGEQTCAFR